MRQRLYSLHHSLDMGERSNMSVHVAVAVLMDDLVNIPDSTQAMVINFINVNKTLK